MKHPEIVELERELALVRGMEERDAGTLAATPNSLFAKIIHNSSDKLKDKLEKRLYRAKAERAHELISLRLIGNQMTGSIRLRTLVSVFEPLNALLEYSAWRFWDKEGKVERIDDHFSNLLDLRLAGIESGSTELVILGNTSPDLTGSSAMEEGLRSVFRLLGANNEGFIDRVHDVGAHGCKALAKLMDVMEKKGIAGELTWSGPEQRYTWHGRPDEITRVKAILNDIGEPEITPESFTGVVQVLSVRNRIEVLRTDTEIKISIAYHRSLADAINDLHLGQVRKFVVERTSYPIGISRQKRDSFSLVEILPR